MNNWQKPGELTWPNGWTCVHYPEAPTYFEVCTQYSVLSHNGQELVRICGPNSLEQAKKLANLITATANNPAQLFNTAKGTDPVPRPVERVWIVAQQHPTLPEVSIFTTINDKAANDYKAIGWTTLQIDLPAPYFVDGHERDLLAWAVSRWKAEVESRPLVNGHRRTLDDTWRQVIRYAGGDPAVLLPLPPHDTMVRQQAVCKVVKGKL